MMSGIPEVLRDVWHSWTPRKQKAAEALAEGATYGAAATAAEISYRHLYRYRQDPEFIAVVDAFRSERLEDAKKRLTSATADAVQVLLDIVKDDSIDAKGRVAAAKAILDRTVPAGSDLTIRLAPPTAGTEAGEKIAEDEVWAVAMGVVGRRRGAAKVEPGDGADEPHLDPRPETPAAAGEDDA